MRAASARIAALYYYPVKSARGVELEEARLTTAGFPDDRRWMLITPAGRFLSQRERPRLALLRASLSADELRLEGPAVPPLILPLSQQGAARRVQIWNDQCEAFDEGDAAASWLQRLLGFDCRLVRFDSSRRRLSESRWTGEIEAETRFQDAFPLLIVGAASLQDLNQRLATALPVNRFRPNLLLEGLGAYDEDDIAELLGDGVRLRLVKACVRCKITTTDQDTGICTDDEPLRALKRYRYDRAMSGVCFGQNAIVVEGGGCTLKRGQRLEIRWKPGALET